MSCQCVNHTRKKPGIFSVLTKQQSGERSKIYTLKTACDRRCKSMDQTGQNDAIDYLF